MIEAIEVIERLHEHIESIKHANPDFYESLEDADLTNTDELLQLIYHAPTIQIMCWLTGKLEMSVYLNYCKKKEWIA
jgi:hypothetical protein